MKTSKKILSFILSVIICFAAFPSTAFAAAERTVTHAYLGILFKSGVPLRSESDTLPISITSDDKLQSDISDIEVAFTIDNCTSNSTLTATYVFNGGGAYRIQSFKNVQAYYRTSKETSEIIDISDYSYDASTGTFTFSIDVDEVGSDGYCVVTSWLGVASTINGNAKAWARLTGVSVTSESQEKGWQNKIAAWFNNLFQWLKDIRDNLTNMSTNVGKWFTDLKDNIKGFFTELGNSISNSFTEIKNNLKTWFDNVGQWFSILGDNIKGFFDNLWNNIADKINSITITIEDWWQGVVDFFHSLFVPEDGYFDSYKDNWDKWARAHFALFYDVEMLFEEFIYLFRSDTEYFSSTLTIPSVKLPFFGNKEIIPETSFDIYEFVNSNAAMTNLYNIYCVLISVFFYTLLLRYILSVFSRIIAGDKEAL